MFNADRVRATVSIVYNSQSAVGRTNRCPPQEFMESDKGGGKVGLYALFPEPENVREDKKHGDEWDLAVETPGCLTMLINALHLYIALPWLLNLPAQSVYKHTRLTTLHQVKHAPCP